VGSTALRVDKTGLGDIRIVQDPSGFCYGADAVMLAGFAAERLARSRNAPQRLCDLGTGNGIIPLLLSHHTEIREITGIDVQGRSIELAQQSNVLNGLTERLRFLVGNVRDIQKGASLLEALGGEGSYSVVTCNPPYTENCGGMKCEDAPRLIARHEVLGSLADFLQGVSLLLRDKGDLFLVHRPARMVDVMCTCREHRLEPKTLQLVSGKRGEAPNIMLLHCVKNGGRELRTLPQQCAREENGAFSPWMKKMYQGEKNTAI
jgi:tRNA1Val (adenine37-N6)-methyltransferase